MTTAPMTQAPDAQPPRITSWDRAAIVALGAAGCALSYDALQQMAVAIHIRGLLTYLFPFVIDGFIGYGVRAVLVMRNASLGARCYVWMLFGTATAASIWANALHAVRLNAQPGPGPGALRLGDVTVGVLSTLAPLALAGAVHLYILIARRVTESGHIAGTADTRVTAATTVRAESPASAPVTGPNGTAIDSGADSGRAPAALSAPVTGRAPDRSGARVGAPTPATACDDGSAADPEEDRPGRSSAAPGTAAGRMAGTGLRVGPHAGELETLLPLARRAVTDADKVTRKVVADAIRGQDIPLSNDRLTELMRRLRTEAPAIRSDR